ncbi:hypothetical protein GC105_07735 [Alkalibaculum sp. M08DMB]|uniref:Polysaccharide biosynthesis protein CapD-like domain-containing protein n=1 Tax=Alkalibaculum sporogenes TaxID=2655001 RepID=A0A6A7K858_9FIRM|nr:polysaccharide biosynthesis protein [Alkalibaculum sporogenes]MPW25679.1 hypothetical protein [Alkalibaculum sporogenes]
MIENKENNKKPIITLLADVFLLIISFIISLYIVRSWYIFDYLRVFIDGIFIVILTKLTIILICFKFFIKNDKINVILAVVATYNLFSFLVLQFISFDFVYEVSTINFIIDIVLISLSRLFLFIKPKSNTTDKILNEYIEVEVNKELSMGESIDICNDENHITIYSQAPLIISKDMEYSDRNRLHEVAPESVIFEFCTVNNVTQELKDLKNTLKENTFDSVIIHTKNFYRLEFLDIIELLKDIPISVDLMDEEISLFELTSMEDIINNFPLNVEYNKFLLGDILLLYTGDICETLLDELIKGNSNVTIVENTISTSLHDKYCNNKKIEFIQILSLEDLKLLLSNGFTNIIYSLPVTDADYGEREIKKTIEQNIINIKNMLNCIPEDKTRKITFISSYKAQKPKSILGYCYKNVEVIMRSLDKYSKIDLQVIRMPESIKKGNKFIKDIHENLSIEEYDARGHDVYVYMYSDMEAALLITNLLHISDSVIVYMGNQLYIPELLNNINLKGRMEDKIKVNYNEERLPLEFYIDDVLEYTKYQSTDNPYVFLLPDTNVDYMIVSKIINILQTKIKSESDEVCKEYLKQLAI